MLAQIAFNRLLCQAVRFRVVGEMACFRQLHQYLGESLTNLTLHSRVTGVRMSSQTIAVLEALKGNGRTWKLRL